MATWERMELPVSNEVGDELDFDDQATLTMLGTLTLRPGIQDTYRIIALVVERRRTS